MTQDGVIDSIDATILAALQDDGRRSFADLGTAAGISAPAAHERVRKLESRGVIRGYAARLDPEAAGYGVLAFMWVTQAPGTISTDLTGDFATIPEIDECHRIAGEADYLLKIRARDTRDLERVVRAIQATRHVFTSETDVVFSTAFEHRPIPVREDPVGRGRGRQRRR
jgi:Lrp/AsnC family leucine-responsive transcriptional regulator